MKETLLPHVAVREQVSVLTDQVEAQGVKISDLQSSLEEHQHKLDSTEEMLQQVKPQNSSAQLEKPRSEVRGSLVVASSRPEQQKVNAEVTSASWTDIPALLWTE